MERFIRYGEASQLCIDLHPQQIVAENIATESLEAVADRVFETLAAPRDYPALAECVVPGDSIALLVDPNVAQPVDLIAGVFRYLLQMDRKPARITVVLAPTENGLIAEVEQQIATSSSNVECRGVVHDPSDDDQLSFLMATQEGAAVYVNRHLTEADMVLPLLATRLDRTLGYRGAYTGIYPTFGDRASAQRLAGTSATTARGETNEVGASLGLHFTLAVVPGSQGGVAEVIAGEAYAAETAACRLAERYWTLSTEHPAQVVIAALSGSEQSWASLAPLLFQLDAFGAPDSVFVICTDIAQPPARAIHCLTDWDVDPDAAFRQIQQQESDDAQTALLLGQLRETNRVFFMSRIDDSLVEDLGLGVLNDADDLSRLCAGKTVAIVEDAHLVLPTPLSQESSHHVDPH